MPASLLQDELNHERLGSVPGMHTFPLCLQARIFMPSVTDACDRHLGDSKTITYTDEFAQDLSPVALL
jgi:hypothetical protein